ncbi:MFS transporter [Streptomyces winkii]|uniref:MFS transporter n=1 Tax=Streptomyces winkii TaxID=3051178 RepID=UPI0028D4BBAA|nr:MFS transporter [Streptomyces sp. DSM 40971]
MSSRNNRSLPLLPGFLVGWGTTTFGCGLAQPLLAVYLKETVGLSASGVSFYFGLFAVAGLAVNPLIGTFGARWDPGRVAVFATVPQTAGALLLVQAESMSTVMLAALLSGTGTGTYYAVQTPVLSGAFGESALSRVLSAQNQITAATMALGAVVGGQLADRLGTAGFQLGIAGNGVSYLLYGIALARVLRLRHGAGARPRAFPGGLEDGGRRERGASPRRTPFTNTTFLLLLLLQSTLVTFGLGQLDTVLPVVLRDAAKLSVSAGSLVLAVNSLSVLLIQPLALRLVHRIGYVGALRAAVAVWAVSLLALYGAVHATGQWLQLTLAALFGLVFSAGQCLIAPSVQPLVVALAPPGRMPAYAAATSLVHGLGGFLAPMMCLPVFTAGGIQGYLILQLVGYAVAAGALLPLGRRTRHLRQEREDGEQLVGAVPDGGR